MRTLMAPFIAVAPGILATAPLHAQDREFALQYGQDHSNYDGAGAALRLTPWWSKNHGRWTTTLRPELELNHFRYSGPESGPGTMNEAGASALLRFNYGDGSVRPFAELGLGLSLFSDDRLGGKGFSTHFQFTERVGLGLDFSGKWFAGWRYVHYSNANIEKPNSGLDLQQIVIGIRF